MVPPSSIQRQNAVALLLKIRCHLSTPYRFPPTGVNVAFGRRANSVTDMVLRPAAALSHALAPVISNARRMLAPPAILVPEPSVVVKVTAYLGLFVPHASAKFGYCILHDNLVRGALPCRCITSRGGQPPDTALKTRCPFRRPCCYATNSCCAAVRLMPPPEAHPPRFSSQSLTSSGGGLPRSTG